MKKIISVFTLLTILICGFSYAEQVDTDKTIKTDRYIKDSLETYDEVDYFNFYLSRQGSVQIEFEFDVEGRYNIKLYDVDNNNKELQNTAFYTNYNTTSGKETLFANKLRLPAGEYRVKVSTSSNYFTDADYELRVNYESESKGNYEVENNNDAKNAMEIDDNETITGNLQSSSDVDYYMIELPYDGKLQLNFEYYHEGAYNIGLYRTEGTGLKEIQSNKASTQTKPYGDDYFNQSFNKVRLPEGTYYVKISSSTFVNDDYNLTVLFNVEKYGNFEKEINNDAKNATEIYNNIDYKGNLSSSSDVDYYVGYLTKGEANLAMEIPEGARYTVTIFKETSGGKLENVISKEINSEKKSIEIPDVTESCRYYFKIAAKTYSNEDYTIKFVNNIQVPVYQGVTTIDLQIGNTYMNVNGVGRLIDNNGTMPVLSSGRTMLPIRAVIETLGGTIDWDNDTFTTTVAIGNKNIKIKIGDKVAYVNGTAKSLDVPAQLINQRTMLPLRFIMENLGGNVTWDDATQIVVIKY